MPREKKEKQEEERMPQPQIPGSSYTGSFNQEDFKDWIIKCEQNFNKVKDNYDEDREYFENVQAPSNVPSDKTYIVENRLVDLNRRLSGQVVSGKLNPSLRGGGEMMVPVHELFMDIFEENSFKEYHLEEITNHGYCEGYCGIKFRYNPMKRSKYGVGSPEIYFLNPDELWLDPDARDGMHRTDMLRIHPQRMLLAEAKKRWPEKAEEINQTYDDNTAEDTEVQRYCDIYEIEFKETFFVQVPVKKGSDEKIKLEVDKYFIVKVANKVVILEGPEETGYPFFRLIPVIHTPRISKTYGKYPYGPNRLLGQTQDNLNTVSSLINEAVKLDTKTLAFISGASDEEVAEYETEASKIHGRVIFKSPNAKVNFAPRTGLVPSLIQAYEIIGHRFDRIQGDFAPTRGEVKGNLAGVTVHQLVTQGIMSEFVAQSHFEAALTDLAKCVLHCIKTEMNTPFMIKREIAGEDKEIPFNISENPSGANDPYMVSTKKGLNVLSQIEMGVSVEIEMNHEMKRQTDIQLAIIAHDRQKLSTEDFLKALFPKTYQEKLENLKEENDAMTLVREMMDLGPEAMNYVRNIVTQMKPAMEAIEKESGVKAQSIPGLRS